MLHNRAHPSLLLMYANTLKPASTPAAGEQAQALLQRVRLVRLLRILGPWRGQGPSFFQREKYTRAMELQEKRLPPEHPERFGPLLGMGLLSLAESHPAEAWPWLERALAVSSVARRARVQFPLARALWEAGGEKPRAVELATQAREFWSRQGLASEAKQVSRWLEAHALSPSVHP